MNENLSLKTLREAMESLPDRYMPREQFLLVNTRDHEKAKRVAGMKTCPCDGIPEVLHDYEPGEEAEKAYLWIIVHGTKPPETL